MKSPINIAKKSYNELLRINELSSKLDQLSARLDILEQKLTSVTTTIEQKTDSNTKLLQNVETNTQLLQDKLEFIIALEKYSTDITKIPAASGFELAIQTGNFILYKDIAKILKSNNIPFFVDFGILIGLVRHNGFIPWDDDIDISIPRTEYKKLPKLFDSTFKNSGLKYIESEIIRIYYKKTPLQLDIFPIDFYNKQLDNTSKEKLKEKIINYHSLIKFNWDNLFQEKNTIISPTLSNLRNIYHQNICKNDISPTEAKQCKPAIIHSPESPRGDRTYILDYDDIFPIQETTFLNETIPVPNNIHQLLTKYYGDYASFPNDMGKKHDDIKSRINRDTIDEINHIINAKGIIK